MDLPLKWKAKIPFSFQSFSHAFFLFGIFSFLDFVFLNYRLYLLTLCTRNTVLDFATSENVFYATGLRSWLHNVCIYIDIRSHVFMLCIGDVKSAFG